MNDSLDYLIIQFVLMKSGLFLITYHQYSKYIISHNFLFFCKIPRSNGTLHYSFRDILEVDILKVNILRKTGQFNANIGHIMHWTLHTTNYPHFYVNRVSLHHLHIDSITIHCKRFSERTVPLGKISLKLFHCLVQCFRTSIKVV